MHQIRSVPAKRPAQSALGKVAEAIVERLNGLLEAIVPQQQLRPIPVRVRSQNRR